jgi:type IV pilus assembly protein PilP
MKILFFYLSYARKLRSYFLIGFFGLLILGCLESKQQLVLNHDGSGKLIAQYTLGEKLTSKIEMSEMGLPLNAKDLKREFQGKGIEIENFLFEKKDEKLNISYTIAFDNIMNSLHTKAFKRAELSFYRDLNNNLAFRMDTKNLLKRTLREPELLKGLTADLILTMPGKLLESNADTVEGTTLTWHYTPDKLKPELMTAACEGAGLPFLAKLSTEPKKIVTSGYVYDPTGKPDPFRPFIIEVSRPKEVVKKPLHPLQRYEISQLKLVGIIWQIGNPRAIFEDATGKGYIVVKGSYVGKKDGRVSDILENGVIITEKSTNIFGETETKEIRVKLHEEERKRK